MSNPFYTYSGSIIPGTLGRAEAIAAEFQSVQAGFADLATAGTDTGSAVAYVVATPAGQPSAPLVDGAQVSFKAANTNSGNATLNVNATGALPLLQYNGSNLQAANITAGSWYVVTYNSTYNGWTLPGAVAITYTGSISSAAPIFPVQLTAVGGSSTSAMPIDAKLAISTAISPTWVGNHTFTGTSTFSGPTTISGAAVVSGPLSVSGITTFSAGVSFTSPASFSGTATVSGVLAVSGTSTFSGPLTISGTSTFSGPISVTGTSVSSGPWSFSNNLTVTGTASFSGPFTVGGTATFTTVQLTSLFAGTGQLFFGVPSSTSTSAALTDVGKCIEITGTATVPNAIFGNGHALAFYNNSGTAVTIVASITTMRLAGGTSTGNRTLAARGLCSVWFVSGTECVVAGAGVS